MHLAQVLFTTPHTEEYRHAKAIIHRVEHDSGIVPTALRPITESSCQTQGLWPISLRYPWVAGCTHANSLAYRDSEPFLEVEVHALNASMWWCCPSVVVTGEPMVRTRWRRFRSPSPYSRTYHRSRVTPCPARDVP